MLDVVLFGKLCKNHILAVLQKLEYLQAGLPKGTQFKFLLLCSVNKEKFTQSPCLDRKHSNQQTLVPYFAENESMPVKNEEINNENNSS